MNYDAKIDRDEDGTSHAEFAPAIETSELDRLKRRRAIVFAAMALAILVGIFLYLHSSKSDTLAPDRASQVPVVTVITPVKTTVAGRIGATGTLAARREEPVGVPGDGGQIVRVLVEPGDWVSAGAVLATIDRSVQTQQAASLAAQIRVADADARLAQANIDRALKLVDRGFISRADLDRLTASRDAAGARVGVARAQLAEMQARVRRLDIVAPSAGLVLERKVEPGQVVGSGSGVLFRLARGGEMELLARLSEEDLAKVAVGTMGNVTPVGSGRTFAGEIWQVSPVIDQTSRQGTVRIALPFARELRPGGFAAVEIAAGTQVAAVLPESAILADGKGSYVYIVGKGDKVERRDIGTGMIVANGVVVTRGLAGGERVVKRAGAFLSTGESVKPRAAD
jgi:HlyD family secretion protein